MAIPQRTATQGTFFLTTVTYNRRRIFQLPANADLFLETLQHYRPYYLLHAFVLMPDHVHLILAPRDKTLSQVMNLIKGGFSHRLASKFPSGKEASPTIPSALKKTSPPTNATSIKTPSPPASPKQPKPTPTPLRTQPSPSIPTNDAVDLWHHRELREQVGLDRCIRMAGL
jgi:REP element-mobilizing transposase RayT